MKTINEVKTEDDYISLSKLVGSPIKDIVGWVSSEFGDPVFKVTKVLFENGDNVYMEDEHDMPYIPTSDKTPGLSEDQLNAIKEEDD